MTVWLHFPTIGVEINISNGSLKFVKKVMQCHSFKLDLKCLEILECINEKICIIRICSNYTKCVFLKWAKSILTLYPCCIVCVCITSTQDASHRSRRKSCHYKNEKRKKIYYAPLFCTITYSIANGSSIYTYRVGFKYWPCWIHCYNPSEQRVFLSGCTSFLSFIFLIEKGYVSRLTELLFK